MPPRHCRPWQAPARVTSRAELKRRRDDAAPCPPHHPSPSASARRDLSAAEPSGVCDVRARARRASRRRRGPRHALHAFVLPYLSPLVQSPPPRRVRTPLPLCCLARARAGPSARTRARRTPWPAEHGNDAPRVTRSPSTTDRSCSTPSLPATPLAPSAGPSATTFLSPPPSRGNSDRLRRYKNPPPHPLFSTHLHHLPLTLLTPEHRQEGELSPAATVHTHGSALPRRGRGRPRPGRTPLPLLSLWPLPAPPLLPCSPATICRCFLHSSVAEDSPELAHGRGGGAEHAVDGWSRPCTRNLSQKLPTPSAVDSDHLRHLPCSQVSYPCSSPSPARRRRPFMVDAVRGHCAPLDLYPTVAYRFVCLHADKRDPPVSVLNIIHTREFFH